METKALLQSSQRGRWILVVLRWTVALQCVGNWRWFTQIEETPLLSWMINPSDIGGLGWSEATAISIQQTLGWSLLAAAVVLVWTTHTVVLALASAVQVLLAVAMWRLAEGFNLQADWLPPSVLTLFPFATQLLRMAAPFALLLLIRDCSSSQVAPSRTVRVMELLRWATAIVFFVHGIEALQRNPKFIDLMIVSTEQTLGWNLSESTAAMILTTIGTIDVLAAVACVSFRSLPIMGWVAFWGGLTAMSRVVAHGWDVAWHQAFTRVPHFGVPLAVALWWYLLRSDAFVNSQAPVEPEQLRGSDSRDSTKT